MGEREKKEKEKRGGRKEGERREESIDFVSAI